MVVNFRNIVLQHDKKVKVSNMDFFRVKEKEVLVDFKVKGLFKGYKSIKRI